jgi:hypothetical protein
MTMQNTPTAITMPSGTSVNTLKVWAGSAMVSRFKGRVHRPPG